MTRVAVLQSNYIPWKGYFDIIHSVDKFIFYDDVQFTKNDWRNRNRIKTSQGVQWLTVPVGQSFDRRIDEVEIPDAHWQAKHWKTISQSYARAPHFEQYRGFCEDVYLSRRWEKLSELNQHLITHISREFLGIRTEFDSSKNYTLTGQKSERLLALVRQTGALIYVSGPSARDYLDEAEFCAAGIAVEYANYSGYPEYPQVWPPFEHAVSILDLLFHTGPDAPLFIWGWRDAG